MILTPQWVIIAQNVCSMETLSCLVDIIYFLLALSSLDKASDPDTGMSRFPTLFNVCCNPLNLSNDLNFILNRK